MTNELVKHLFALTLASSFGIIAALVLRRAVRPVLGSPLSYSIWLIVPIAMMAAILPHGVPADSEWSITAGQGSFSPLSGLIDASYRTRIVTLALIHWSAGVVGVWAAGTAIFALYLARIQRAFVASLGNLSGSQCVLRAEHSAGCPALLGVLRPKIILPADFNSRYTRAERLLIVAHERTHLRRGDGIWNAIDALLRCIFWFNPLVHLASIYFRIDQELACDAAVLRDHFGAHQSYARALVKAQFAQAALPAGCHWRSARFLKERLNMVKKPVVGTKLRACGNLFVVLCSSVIGYSVWAAQPPSALGNVESAALHGADRPGSQAPASNFLAMAPAGPAARAADRLHARMMHWPAGSVLQKFYPTAARTRGIAGMVYIAVTLDKMGRATDTRILSVTPRDLGFGAAASTLVHYITFSNPTGHRVVVKFHVKFAPAQSERGRHHVQPHNRPT